MAYIISVNANTITQSGGTCVCPSDGPDLCDTDPAYSIGVQEINRDLVPATAAIAALTSFCMGLFANMSAQQYPATPQDKANSNAAIALAPGMRLNVYFAYTVVGYHGPGPVPYGVVLTAVFVESFVFVAFTLLGIGQWLARTIPAFIKLATGVGIVMYLTIMGLTYSAGIGAIIGQASTPVELAGCALEFRGENGFCPNAERMGNPTMWIGIFRGGVLTVLLMMYQVKGAIIMESWFPYFGSPPVTTYREGGAGISEGGKTGLTAIFTGIAFFISIFFAPIFASIPPWATRCTLIIVGSLMAKSAADINWRYYGDAVPAFIAIAVMSSTYSIAYGLIAGIITYMVLNTTM